MAGSGPTHTTSVCQRREIRVVLHSKLCSNYLETSDTKAIQRRHLWLRSTIICSVRLADKSWLICCERKIMFVGWKSTAYFILFYFILGALLFTCVRCDTVESYIKNQKTICKPSAFAISPNNLTVRALPRPLFFPNAYSLRTSSFLLLSEPWGLCMSGGRPCFTQKSLHLAIVTNRVSKLNYNALFYFLQ